MVSRRTSKRGFTLVEILIVVIILGILAAIVIPQFTNASQDARKNALTSQLQTIRGQIELYKLQHKDSLPTLLAVDASDDWSQLTGSTDIDGGTSSSEYGPYLQSKPVNPLNGYSAIKLVSSDVNLGDALVTSGVGFILNHNNGKVWATSAKNGHVFDESDTENAVNAD